MSTATTLYPLSAEEIAYFESFPTWDELVAAVNELPDTGPGSQFYVAFGDADRLAWLERKGQDFSASAYPKFTETDYLILRG